MYGKDGADNIIAYNHTNNKILSYSGSKTEYKESIGDYTIMPDIKKGFETVFICGRSGSGKTYFAADYMTQYRKLFRNNNIFLFSQKKEDETIDKRKIKNIKKIIIDDDFINSDFDLTTNKQYHNSLCVFDDFLYFTNKKIVNKLKEIITQFMTLGRQYKIYTLATSHMFYSVGGGSKEFFSTMYLEFNRIVFFRDAPFAQLAYVFWRHYRIGGKFLKKLFQMDEASRYYCISNHPNYILTKHRCILY
jgi:hypothetical protein